MNLRDLFKPGDKFKGITCVQTDFHQFNDVPSVWEVTAVYPNWLEARNTKKQVNTRYTCPEGCRASFSIGDLVHSGLIDPFYANPQAAVRRV